MIYHTRGEHANRYTIDEPMIYHTRDEHANRYTIDAVGKIDAVKMLKDIYSWDMC